MNKRIVMLNQIFCCWSMVRCAVWS